MVFFSPRQIGRSRLLQDENIPDDQEFKRKGQGEHHKNEVPSSFKSTKGTGKPSQIPMDFENSRHLDLTFHHIPWEIWCGREPIESWEVTMPAKQIVLQPLAPQDLAIKFIKWLATWYQS